MASTDGLVSFDSKPTTLPKFCHWESGTGIYFTIRGNIIMTQNGIEIVAFYQDAGELFPSSNLLGGITLPFFSGAAIFMLGE